MNSECREPGTSSNTNQTERERYRRHAFLITGHERPKQVQLLLDLIDHPRNDMFLALDAKGDVRASDLHATTSGLTFVPSGIMNWAAYSVVRADLDLLAAAVPGNYHYYHMITGSDLPLVGPEVLHQRLEASDTEYIQLEPERAAEARYKAAFRHPLVDLPAYRKNLAMRGSRWAIVLLQKVLHLEKSAARGVRFHHSSSYFSITHDFARYVVDQRPWIERTFKHGLACDEVFIPTVLMRSPFAAKVAEDRPGCPANLRCIDWSRRVHHSPHTFTEADIPMLRESSGTALFARKFNSELDPRVVAAIAEWVREPRGGDQPA